MNGKTLDKLYDKLAPRERLAAMVAALGRKDWDEYHKLGRSAPKGNTYTVRNTHGLLEAWELLAMFHMILQLGNLASFFFLTTREDDEKIKPENRATVGDAINKVTMNIIEGSEAWRAICKEYNLDPKAALAALPFVDVVEIGEVIANFSAGITEGTGPDFEGATNTYREFINCVRETWE